MTKRREPDSPYLPDPERTRDGRPRRRRPRATRPIPVTPAMLEGAPDFAPVPRGSARYDGWTPARQRAFIKALAETGIVHRAAAAVGMATPGAYQLRLADGAEGFRAAWEEALAYGVQRLADIAYERAIHGVSVPVYYHGELVGERRRYDNRLLTWVLRHRDPDNYGGTIKDRVPPHVRRRLYAEWDAERATQHRLEDMAREKERRDAEPGTSARERLAAKLEQMRQRLAEDDDAPAAAVHRPPEQTYSLPAPHAHPQPAPDPSGTPQAAAPPPRPTGPSVRSFGSW